MFKEYANGERKVAELAHDIYMARIGKIEKALDVNKAAEEQENIWQHTKMLREKMLWDEYKITIEWVDGSAKYTLSKAGETICIA